MRFVKSPLKALRRAAVFKNLLIFTGIIIFVL